MRSISESFQSMRGSSIRLWSWRVCSSWLTSSQDFTSTMPESTMAFSTPGNSCRNRVTWSCGTEAHDPFDTAAVVPAAVEDHDLAGGREVRNVPLHVHL